MEKSLTNSQHSNFFIISSESSRNSPKHNISKHQYAIFAKKVKKLLDTSGDDLDQLYKRIEIIVSKYFNDNKIVQFKDMYEHISALKSNNKRMEHIVNILQKKMLSQTILGIKQDSTNQRQIKLETQVIKESNVSKNSFKNQQFETTSSLQKSVNKQKKKDIEKSPFFRNNNTIKQKFNQSNPFVITSLKENHIIQHHHPQSQSLKAQKQPKKQQQSQQLLPHKQYHNHLASNLDQFKTRNKTYEEKIKELMQQLQAIKKMASTSIVNNQSNIENQDQIQELNKIKRSEMKKQVEKELLQQNQQLNQQIKIERMASTIEYFTKNDNKQMPLNGDKNQIRPKKISIELNNNNVTTFNQQRLNNLTNIANETQYIILEEASADNSINKNISIQNHLINPSSSSSQINHQNSTKSEKKSQLINLLQYTTNISKQIQQLQQVASKLQLESLHVITQQQKKILQSQTKMMSLDKIKEMGNNIEKEKVAKKAILDQIDNANSKSYITDDNLPSFKHLNQNKSVNQKSTNQMNKKNDINSAGQEDSIIYNQFNATHSSHNTSQLSINSLLPKIPIQQQQFIYHQNSHLIRNNGPINYQLQTMKYAYNPYEPLSMPPPLKTYNKFSQSSPLQYNPNIYYPSKSTQIHSLKSSNNNQIYHQTKPNSMEINMGKNIIKNRAYVDQVEVIPNQKSNRSIQKVLYSNDPPGLHNQQITLNNSINLIKSNSSIINGSGYKSRQNLREISYVQNGNLIKSPALISNSSTKIREINSPMRSINNGMDQSVRMSDSLTKKKGIQLISTLNSTK